MTSEKPERITRRGPLGSQAGRTCLPYTPADSGILPGERIGLQVIRVGPHRQETALGKGRSLSRIRNCSLDVRRARYLALRVGGGRLPTQNAEGPEAVATARTAAGGKNLEILGADVAAQCLQRGLVDEILVYVLPVLLGDGIRFSPPGLPRIDLEPVSTTRSGTVTILRFRVRK